MTSATDEGAKAREQLAEVERLDEVVVGAAVEALDACVDGVPWRSPSGSAPRSPTRGTARHTVNPSLRGSMTSRITASVIGRGHLEQRRFAVGGQIDGVGLLAKPLRQHVRRRSVRLQRGGGA